MTPGWYNAEGDPVGTQRYWDGAQWLGEPVYEPAAAPAGAPVFTPAPQYVPPTSYPPPAPYSAQAASTFPSGLKVLAIIVSILKAIPLAFGLLFVLLLGAFADIFDDSTTNNDGFEGLFNVLAGFLLVFIAIGALLIGFQLAGAISEKPMMVLIPALIMSLLDVLSTLGAWVGFVDAQGGSAFNDPSPGGPLLITVVAALQVTIAVMAIRAHNSQSRQTTLGAPIA